jgi:spermidine/putrescine transport system substrate-binding protein
VLSGCGIAGAGRAGPVTAAEVADYWRGRHAGGTMVFANYAEYIDVESNNPKAHPSLQKFTAATGIRVDYQEVIDDDASTFARIVPELEADVATGWDLMVVGSDNYLTELREIGYLVPLERSRLPHFYRYAAPGLKNPNFDPGNHYTVPWAAGMTGIAYNPARVPKPIRSWQDLLSPSLKGKVTMFADNLQLPNCALLAIGVNPETSAVADWHKAAEWLERQRESGTLRAYVPGTPEYIEQMLNGDSWAGMAYSGDVVNNNISSKTKLQFVIPSEGALIWTDNLCIPKASAHAADAIALMDWYYRPEIAALLAAYIGYVAPVPASRAFMLRNAARMSGSARRSLEYVANSPLVFPSRSMYRHLYRFRTLTMPQAQAWNTLFEPIFES